MELISIRQTENFNVGQKKRFCTKKRCINDLPRKGVKYLTIIINECLKCSYFPLKFKEAKVIPIRKPNKPPDSPLSYRHISLLSSIGKILEKVL